MESATGLLIALIVGGCVGWLAGLGAGHRKRTNVPAGVFGALLGCFLLGPRLGGGNLLESRFDPMTIAVALAGAVVLVALARLVRRARPRRVDP